MKFQEVLDQYKDQITASRYLVLCMVVEPPGSEPAKCYGVLFKVHGCDAIALQLQDGYVWVVANHSMPEDCEVIGLELHHPYNNVIRKYLTVDDSDSERENLQAKLHRRASEAFWAISYNENEFRETLQDFKRLTCMSAAAISELVDVSTPTVKRWLDGRNQPHPYMRPGIMKALLRYVRKLS